MLGVALQAFETTLDYLKTRVQFGQVIGTFQALQHRAAKMFTDLELARSRVEEALAARSTATRADVAGAGVAGQGEGDDLVHWSPTRWCRCTAASA